MSTLGITNFEDLIAHLDGLVAAAQQAELDPEGVAFLATIRHRLVRIHNHLTGAPAEAEPGGQPAEKTLAGSDDLIEQFDRLTEAARGAGLSPTLFQYLHTAHLRLRFALRSKGNRRVVSRDERTGSARMAWSDGETEVEVVESSAYGLGVLSEVPLAEDAVVEVTTQEEGRTRRYDCLVIHCEKQSVRYHVGLEIFAEQG